jgi:hypothetical protein
VKIRFAILDHGRRSRLSHQNDESTGTGILLHNVSFTIFEFSGLVKEDTIKQVLLCALLLQNYPSARGVEDAKNATRR